MAMQKLPPPAGRNPWGNAVCEGGAVQSPSASLLVGICRVPAPSRFLQGMHHDLGHYMAKALGLQCSALRTL